MRFKARTGVQLTSLLDLLFIMIFIALLTPKLPKGDGDGPVPSPQPDPNPKKDNDNQVEYLVNESIKKKDAIRPIKNGEIRKLFIANTYHKKGRSGYVETNLYAADDNQIWIYRLNLYGAGLMDDRDKLAMTMQDPGIDGMECKSMELSRDKLNVSCDEFDREGKQLKALTINCHRSSDTAYSCDKTLNRDQITKSRYNEWNYTMELVRIYDETLR